VQDGEKTIKADPALDTWALGVMAFELLSREPAFHVLSDGKQEVRAFEHTVHAIRQCIYVWHEAEGF
jgi:serine/threonine protein kinase